MAIILCALVLSLCVASVVALWVSPWLLHAQPYFGPITQTAKIALTAVNSILSFLLLVIIAFLLQLFRNARHIARRVFLSHLDPKKISRKKAT